MFKHVRDLLQGKTVPGTRRSDKWPAVRAAHLLRYPRCSVCGGTSKLEVHHVKPFHLHPELELNPGNLITLCESGDNGLNCHLWFGHLGNFKSVNTAVTRDAVGWSRKFRGRPKP